MHFKGNRSPRTLPSNSEASVGGCMHVGKTLSPQTALSNVQLMWLENAVNRTGGCVSKHGLMNTIEAPIEDRIEK